MTVSRASDPRTPSFPVSQTWCRPGSQKGTKRRTSPPRWGRSLVDVIKSGATKSAFTSGDALSQTVGRNGGTVRIHLQDGKFQEERTFPRSVDPARSPG